MKPKRLKPGARLGIVNPAYWLEPERQQRAVSVFETLGYEVVTGDSTRLKRDRYAGSPEERAADIMAMFADPSIDAIVAARGGYGGNRVLPLLDYEVIRNNPKIFVGYSDITGFLASISQRTGLVTFHGPMLTTYASDTLQYNLDIFHAVLSGKPDIRIDSAEICPARVLKPGFASGPAWGGNLALVVERLGTPHQIDTSGAILFLEEIGERLHAFDRMMLQLRASGSLDNINGLVIGELLEITDGDTPFGKSTDEIVLDVCDGLDIPIVSNFSCGHGASQATVPVSHEIELHALESGSYIRIPQAPVI